LDFEVIEIIEHQVHVFLLLFLQVVNNSLVFVNLNSDVCVCLSRDGPWFNEIVDVDVVASLSSGNLRCDSHLVCSVELVLRLSSDGIVVEVSALFL
jgi:hypothetical protein